MSEQARSEEELAELKRLNVGGGEVEPALGLAPDYINAWMGLGMAVRSLESGRPTDLKMFLRSPVLKYAEYLRSKYPGEAERLIGESDPAVLARLDTLVDEYNAALDDIRDSNDTARLIAFWQRADQQIRGR